ncbi:MAG: hypothetical protein PHT51_02205 [Patescibacteria group bacterium]|nr:hypothetical protein [Patescibacteria group bacterium]MDD4611304.1 hypothetical protein [Patescibacteria group bacterium]
MEKQKNTADIFRHSISGYETIERVAREEGLTSNITPEKQVYPDLTPEGVKLAKRKAVEFFNTFNPEEDALFFASSGEARAIETANIFRQEAKGRGFEIIKPVKTGSSKIKGKLGGEVGEGEIRTVDTLGLKVDKLMYSSVFVPVKYAGGINVDSLGEADREKWDEARKIIEADDKGSWGANFFHHSEEIQKIMPELESVKDQYDKVFKKIIRLIEFGIKKAEESGQTKNIRILAFGHENYLSYALDKYFADHNIPNCGAINFTVDETGVTAEFKNEKRLIKEIA